MRPADPKPDTPTVPISPPGKIHLEYDTGGLVLIEVLRQDEGEHRVFGETVCGVRVPLEKEKDGWQE